MIKFLPDKKFYFLFCVILALFFVGFSSGCSDEAPADTENGETENPTTDAQGNTKVVKDLNARIKVLEESERNLKTEKTELQNELTKYKDENVSMSAQLGELKKLQEEFSTFKQDKITYDFNAKKFIFEIMLLTRERDSVQTELLRTRDILGEKKVEIEDANIQLKNTQAELATVKTDLTAKTEALSTADENLKISENMLKKSQYEN